MVLFYFQNVRSLRPVVPGLCRVTVAGIRPHTSSIYTERIFYGCVGLALHIQWWSKGPDLDRHIKNLLPYYLCCSLYNFHRIRSAVGFHGNGYSKVFFFDDVNDKRFFWKQFLAGVFTVIAMTGLDQDMMQRNLSCKNPADSQKNMVTSVIFQFIVIAMFLMLGVLLYIYVQAKNIALPAKSDELFPMIATQGYFPTIVGILFIVGLISSAYSAAGSALTALTTSFTVDILGTLKKHTDEEAARSRKKVHIGMAFVMGLVIVVVNALNNTSVIDAVYILASYTYGPILGLFAFGIFTKKAVKDKYIPLVAILSPLFCLMVDLNSEQWFNGYSFSYELLIINALFTFVGLCLFIKKGKLQP